MIPKIDKELELDYTIHNVVATLEYEIEERVNLIELIKVFPKAKYNPEKFPGLIYRMKEPKAVFLIFSTGKIVCTGIKTEKTVIEAMAKLSQKIVDLELTIKETSFQEGEFTFV